MDASDKMGVAVSGNGEISTDIFSSEIVNQYGQLVGEFSKLDDELWLSAPDDVEPMAFWNDGFQLDHVSSHLHEHSADLHCADNSITNGGVASVENNSPVLNDSSQSQSRTLSPVSVLQRRSYSKETTFVIRRARSKQCPRSGSSGIEAGQLCPSENYVERFVLDESDSYPGRMLRTRKVSDLLQLHSTEKNYSNAGTNLHQKSLTEQVKRCVHCETAHTPQWRDGPVGRKTLCNACGIQYKKALLSADYHPLSNQKRRKKGSKKCVRCDAAKNLQWRDWPRGRKSLCNACGIRYKKSLRAVKYHSSRAPRSDASLPTKLPKMPLENFEKIAEKNPPFNLYQMKVQETRVAENRDIDRDCGRKGTTIQDMTEKTDDMLDSGSNHRNRKPNFIPIPRTELPKATVKKCDHCESTNTPQWREGPNGRNTLCNACGVQFKKGRLFPEYRPLKSPTYDPSLHSHLPKTVEKMRMRKISAECAKSENNEHAA